MWSPPLSFRTKKSKNWRRSVTSWLQSWERLTEFPLLAQQVCIWLLLTTVIILPYPGVITLLPRKKKPGKKHMPTAACPALLLMQQPGEQPQSLEHCPGRSGPDRLSIFHSWLSVGSGGQATKSGFVISLSLIHFKNHFYFSKFVKFMILWLLFGIIFCSASVLFFLWPIYFIF